MKYTIEHLFKKKSCEITAPDEDTAWEYFLDHVLPLEDEAEDYTIRVKVNG